MLLVAILAGVLQREARAASPAASGSPAEEPKLTPPRAVAAGRVPYPPGATGTAVVVVEIVVDAEGEVTKASLVDGSAPFDAVTLDAARRWRFEPARRADAAVAARIRVRVEFTPSTIVPPLTVPEAAVAPPPLRPAIEVVVKGHKPAPGEITVGGGEVRQIPGAFGDPFRSIEALPGVTPMVSGLPYFFVRGAPPGNTGYFLDGVRVPLLFHVAFGPSVIHPGLIDHVDFYPGGFPAQFGRFAGGIVSAATRNPPTEAHGEANVRVFDAGVLAETPFADGRGSALVAGRYSYTALILSLVSPGTQLAYWDYQTRATWKINDANEIGVFAFGSYDNLGQSSGGTSGTILETEFHRVDLRYDHALGDHGTLRVAATLGYGDSNDGFIHVRDLTAGVRATLEDRLSPSLTLRAGGDVTLDRFDLLGIVAPPLPGLPDGSTLLYPPRIDVAAGGYTDVVWKLSPHVQIVPGLRADVFVSHRFDDPIAELEVISQSFPGAAPRTVDITSTLPALDPRLAARVDLTRTIDLVSTFGVTHQPPSFVAPVPGLSFVETHPILQTAIQMSQGLTVALPADVTLEVTGFLQSYLNLTDLTATCDLNESVEQLGVSASRILAGSFCLNEPVRGRAFGGELFLRRDLTKRLTGWLSYTLSRSTREAHLPGNPESVVEVETLSEFDRTHVLSLVGAYDLGAGWRAGARFFAYSGLPYTNTRGGEPVLPYNDERMPAFYRIDVRLEKRWRLGPRVTIALVFEGMNVTLNKEAVAATCSPTPGESPKGFDTCTFQTVGPISIPSVGVEGSL
jgi:TonB family protein